MLGINEYVLLAIIGAFFVAISESINKKLAKGISCEFVQIMGINFAAAIWLLAYILIRGELQFGLTLSFWLAMVGVVLLNVVIRFCDFRSFKLEEFSRVMPLKGLTIFALMVLGYITLGEKLNAWGIIGLVLIAGGVWLLGLERFGISSFIQPFKKLLSSKGIRYGIVAALVASLALTLEKVSVTNIQQQAVAPFIGVLVMKLMLGTVAGIVVPIHKRVSNLRLSISWRQIGGMMLAGLFSAIHMVCFFAAYFGGQVAYVGGIKRLSILFSVLIGLIIFRETEKLKRLVAGIIIVIGVMIISILGN